VIELVFAGRKITSIQKKVPR